MTDQGFRKGSFKRVYKVWRFGKIREDIPHDGSIDYDNLAGASRKPCTHSTGKSMAFDQREFRNAVGCFATGVTVVTTLDKEGDRVGITANSFSSVSLDPPLVLFCVDAKINSFEAFENCENFNINVLSENQIELSNAFARSSEDKWDGIEHVFGDNGCPIFENSIAVLECDKYAIHSAGDHLIMVGQVTKIAYETVERHPLLYFNGAYASLS
ncbi:MAG: flavin reductase family protein [Pseudomonadota bacterium]|nr:flavin reductase family protein [Pseudomonadota bacterium]